MIPLLRPSNLVWKVVTWVWVRQVRRHRSLDKVDWT